MPNMPCSLSAWLRMRQWKAQSRALLQFTIGLEALAGRDVERVALVRLRRQLAVLVDDRHVYPVQVHRVDHHAFVHEPDPDLLAHFRDERLGGREALAVER